MPGQSVIPAHSPVFHRSSQIFTDLSCHSPSIYPLSTRYSVSKIFTDLLQIFQRSFKNFPSSIPFHWDLDSRSFRPTLQISKLFVSPLLFKTCISWLILHRSSKILPPLSPSTSFLDSRSFRPTLQIFVFSIFSTLLSGQSVILTIFPRWRIHTKFPTRLP